MSWQGHLVSRDYENCSRCAKMSVCCRLFYFIFFLVVFASTTCACLMDIYISTYIIGWHVWTCVSISQQCLMVLFAHDLITYLFEIRVEWNVDTGGYLCERMLSISDRVCAMRRFCIFISDFSVFDKCLCQNNTIWHFLCHFLKGFNFDTFYKSQSSMLLYVKKFSFFLGESLTLFCSLTS